MRSEGSFSHGGERIIEKKRALCCDLQRRALFLCRDAVYRKMKTVYRLP
ncbi:hypothetical protein COLSTE_02301 [Collinsella stercoris DSM 13279]|uniref:Uncharacterized protein n=1 Tax=Collinsella stercoris DSM 13279 TaxID=445975 RepID=B6GDV5_9ACTN|nr:hypothetical protein COLSTE_02301 [Collinsella stercoris DSM 13279]